MKTDIRFGSHLAQFFLEWKLFQTKVADKPKTHILSSVTFLLKLCHLWDNVKKFGRDRKATDDNITRRILFACWITKATNTHSEYERDIVFARQKYSCERASMLYLNYIFSLVFSIHKSLSSELSTEELTALESHYVAHVQGLYIQHN